MLGILRPSTAIKIGRYLWGAAKPVLSPAAKAVPVGAAEPPPGVEEARSAFAKIIERVGDAAAQAHIPDALPWAALQTQHDELDARIKHRNRIALAVTEAWRELNRTCPAPEPVIEPETPPTLRVIGSLRDAFQSKGGARG